MHEGLATPWSPPGLGGLAGLCACNTAFQETHTGCHVCCRVVRADLAQPGAPSSWADVIPQHDKDLLQSALALKGDELIIRSVAHREADARA